MAKVEIDLEWMREQLARYTYKPGWDMMIDLEGTLIVRYLALDSRKPGNPRRFEARRPITPTDDPEAFVRDLAKQLLDIEAHEVWEWLRYDGQLVYDPHADPDRWQCSCGGVGPIKRADAWTCPGCGTEHTTGGTGG